jgi:phosphoribosylglycinamide formyltransferase-1
MRVLSANFIQQYPGHILNIHPSLLPKYKGLHTHRRALEAGDVAHGVSVHFVTESLDGGPLIAQVVVPVLPDDDEPTLSQRVLKEEHQLYPKVIALAAQGRLTLQNDVVVMDQSTFTAQFN